MDASLLFSLLNTVLDWALDHARSSIEFRIDIKEWPAHARLACRFTHRLPDQIDEERDVSVPDALDSLNWRLLEQTAWTMGLNLDRSGHLGGETLLMIEFPRTVNAEVEGARARRRPTTASRRRPTPSRWRAATCW